MTSRNKIYLSAPAYLNPKTGSIALSLENDWEDAMKTPERPAGIQLRPVLFPWGIMGKTMQVSEPELGAGRQGGRQACLSHTCLPSGHAHPPLALTSSP